VSSLATIGQAQITTMSILAPRTAESNRRQWHPKSRFNGREYGPLTRDAACSGDPRAGRHLRRRLADASRDLAAHSVKALWNFDRRLRKIESSIQHPDNLPFQARVNKRFNNPTLCQQKDKKNRKDCHRNPGHYHGRISGLHIPLQKSDSLRERHLLPRV
jgi:hypothetical protein